MGSLRAGTYPLRFIESLDDPEVEVVLLKITLEHVLVEGFAPKRARADAEIPIRELLRHTARHLSDDAAVDRALSHRNDLVHTTPRRYPPTAAQVAFARGALRTAIEDLLPQVSKRLRRSVAGGKPAPNRWTGAAPAAADGLRELNRLLSVPLPVRLLRSARALELTRSVLPRRLMLLHALLEGPERDDLARLRRRPPGASDEKPTAGERRLLATGWYERGRLPAGRRSLRDIEAAPTPAIQLLLTMSLLEYLLVLSDPDLEDEAGRPAGLGHRVVCGRWWPKPSAPGEKGKMARLLGTAVRVRNQLEDASREPVEEGQIAWALAAARDAVRDVLPRLGRPLQRAANETRRIGDRWPDVAGSSRAALETILAERQTWLRIRDGASRRLPVVGTLHRALDRANGAADLYLAVEQGTSGAIERALRADPEADSR